MSLEVLRDWGREDIRVLRTGVASVRARRAGGRIRSRLVVFSVVFGFELMMEVVGTLNISLGRVQR